jgi:hypothetical protein
MSPGRIGFIKRSGLAQASFATAAFTRQQVAQIGTLVLHSAAFGEIESFGSATRCLYLRHTSSTQAAAYALFLLGLDRRPVPPVGQPVGNMVSAA